MVVEERLFGVCDEGLVGVRGECEAENVEVGVCDSEPVDSEMEGIIAVVVDGENLRGCLCCERSNSWSSFDFGYIVWFVRLEAGKWDVDVDVSKERVLRCSMQVLAMKGECSGANSVEVELVYSILSVCGYTM